ncbi:hypothetical protein Nepgr_019178 [Nepenthes gracilis]|uniref:Uncharacterized protein n=1 Tax=Nepenthes gracilis TaxID=150966 RepID=A0AAD3XTT5_NEPGR|nr:hypothetical protein Nepgr_019178 [Nepenthes gracilis]
MQQPREINVDDQPVDDMETAPAVGSLGPPHPTESDRQDSIFGELDDLVDTKTTSKDFTLFELSGIDPMATESMSQIYIHKQSDWRFRSEIEVDGFFLDGLGPKHIQRKAQMQGQDNTPNASVAKKRGRRERNWEFQPSKSKPGLSDLRIPLLRDSNNLVLYDIVMKPPKDTTSKATQPKRQKQ